MRYVRNIDAFDPTIQCLRTRAAVSLSNSTTGGTLVVYDVDIL
jgi:hypothetical protein